MSLFDIDALEPLRTGRRAPAAESLAWLVGLAAVVAGFHAERVGRPFVVVDWLGLGLGLVVAGGCLALVATSVPRAVASGVAFGLTLVVAGLLAWLVLGVDPTLGVRPGPVRWILSGLVAVGLPAVVAGGLRAVG